MNIVIGEIGAGEAVLIRSIVPDENLSLVRERRSVKNEHDLTRGPAKICQALGVTNADNGEKIGGDDSPLSAQKKATCQSHRAYWYQKRYSSTMEICY